MKISSIALLLLLSTSAFAGSKQIPTDENGFIDRIKSVTKDDIVAQFGEPVEKRDLRDFSTGEVFGAVWHYNKLNTSADKGEFFQMTELDFVGDRVVTVVFMNNDGISPYDAPRSEVAPTEKPALPF